MEEPTLFDKQEPAKPKKQKPRVYTVSQINGLIKVALEENLPSRVSVVGEISGFKHHGSGHCYFDLKDGNSILPCVMWKGKFKKVKFKPENGMAVVVKGNIDVFPPQGKYQFYADSIAPEGTGTLQLAFEQMKQRLEAEGLFKEEYKKSLPKFPAKIGILTSESGAALHDIADSIYDRWPVAKLYLYSVPVQGEGAAEKIAEAVKELDGRNKKLKLDVLIVGRGGGSMEDLWAFNEEVLARAIFNSAIPIISAVGHEVDVTIADLAADARASTPTKAGMIAVPDIADVQGQLDSMHSKIKFDIKTKLQFCKQTLQTILASAAFRNPLLLVQNACQRLDQTEAGLNEVTKMLLIDIRQQLQVYHDTIRRIEPHRLLLQKKINLNNLQNSADSAMGIILNGLKLRLAGQVGKLTGLDPKGVLNRGYSITKNGRTGKIITTPADIEIGDTIVTELKEEKKVESEVKKK